jgi:hypothetical protein
MAKRSNFERIERDYYRTFDPRALKPLWGHLNHETHFIEPMAGDGILRDQLTAKGHVCLQAYDIEPQGAGIEQRDALKYKPAHHGFTFITNPPWRRDILHPAIIHLSDMAPTWMIFDSDWAFTNQAAPFMRRLRRIVAVGRVRWIEGTTEDGKDNAAWFLFDKPDKIHQAQFFGR